MAPSTLGKYVSSLGLFQNISNVYVLTSDRKIGGFGRHRRWWIDKRIYQGSSGEEVRFALPSTGVSHFRSSYSPFLVCLEIQGFPIKH